MYKVLVYDEVWRELPSGVHARAKAELRGLFNESTPFRSPRIRPVSGSRIPGTFRVRLGRYRFLGWRIDAEMTVVITTAFLKRRSEDYRAALARHEARVRAYGG